MSQHALWLPRPQATQSSRNFTKTLESICVFACLLGSGDRTRDGSRHLRKLRARGLLPGEPDIADGQTGKGKQVSLEWRGCLGDSNLAFAVLNLICDEQSLLLQVPTATQGGATFKSTLRQLRFKCSWSAK